MGLVQLDFPKALDKVHKLRAQKKCVSMDGKLEILIKGINVSFQLGEM